MLKLSNTPFRSIEIELQEGLDLIKEKIKICYSSNPQEFWNKNKLLAHIELKDKSKIIRVKPMRHNELDVKEFNIQIKELMDYKLIQDSSSHHSSPAFMVRNHAEIKRGKARMVINYTTLNAVTIFYGYFLPHKHTLINTTRGKKIHSKFDCKSGFYQIRLTDEAKPLTTFSTPQGHYEWTVLPLGLKNAPQIFQRKMDNILKSFDYIHVYVDDILISSSNILEHIKHLNVFADKYFEHGLVLSDKKSVIAANKIEFLGLIIDETGIEMQDHITKKINDFPDKITDVKQLQRILGVLNYAEGFIMNLAEYRKPLQKLLRKNTPFEITSELISAVKILKNKCQKLPKLAMPLDTDNLIIETDASEKCWSAVLKKIVEANEILCRYTSGTFTDTEERYHINEKELLAVVKGFKKFSYFLLPKRFVLRTDNTQVKSFLQKNLPSTPEYKRLIRWQSYCAEYIYDIEVNKSSKNILADFLTRDGIQ